jgi:hypothetical protein
MRWSYQSTSHYTKSRFLVITFLSHRSLAWTKGTFGYEDMGEEIGGRLQIPSLFGVAGLCTRHRGQSNFGDAALE